MTELYFWCWEGLLLLFCCLRHVCSVFEWAQHPPDVLPPRVVTPTEAIKSLVPRRTLPGQLVSPTGEPLVPETSKGVPPLLKLICQLGLIEYWSSKTPEIHIKKLMWFMWRGPIMIMKRY